MPEVNGRYVPDGHEAAGDADPPEKKTATRKRGGKKAETAMMDQPSGDK